MKGKKDNQKVSFSKLDNNSDGKISISEYLDNPNQEFDTLDSNRDGFLTKEELNGKESSDPHAHH
jgi:Ca2+-binding EF-hand superfamily protein